MKRKYCTFFIILTILLCSISIYATPIVKLNRKTITTTVMQLQDGKRYLSLKDLLAPLGYTISFDKPTKSFKAVKGDSVLIYPQEQNYMFKNGVKITLPSTTKSLNGSIHVASDVLTPSLNATAMYFPDTETLEIEIYSRLIDTQLATIPKLEMPQDTLVTYRRILEPKLAYVIDERLFTLMCYANYHGYSFEYNTAKWSPVRKSIIATLKEKSFTLTVPTPDFSSSWFKNGMVAPIARALGPAPDFDLLDDSQPVYSEFSVALREFYQAADIHSLFLAHQKDYEEAIKDYKESEILDALCNLIYFLKIKPEDAPPMTILINLADANLNGFGLTYDPAYQTNTVIMGPGKVSSGKVIVMHEYLHGIVGPILNKYSEEIERTNALSEVSNLSLIKAHYNDWQSVVEESLVRALDILPFSFPRHTQLGGRKQEGFLLIDYFFNQFANYPKYQGDLDSFIYKCLVDYSTQ